MNKILQIVALIGCLAFSGALSLLLGQTTSPSIEQQLRSEYRLTKVGADGTVVGEVGSVLVIQPTVTWSSRADGLSALPALSGVYWYTTYNKEGQAKCCTLQHGGTVAYSKYGHRNLQVGEKVYLTDIQVKPNEIAFFVQTCGVCDPARPDPNNPPYLARLAFEFDKGYLSTADLKQVLEKTGRVLALDASPPRQASQQRPPNPAQGAPQTSIFGLYVVQSNGSQLQLNPDGSFSQRTSTGRVYLGHFTVNGDTLAMAYANGTSRTFSIHGDTIYNQRGEPTWVRQGGAPAPAIPPVAPLKLPSTYVSAQTPADQLQLNADNSFSLQEGGQPYRGTFVINGNTIELSISETSTKTTLSRQGNDLTDSSGQAWSLREQSAGTAPNGAMLQNEDIIKMAKVGIDDATIIAKISSSKCQFDTSTDALIQLKQGGVSAAVLKAMVGAGK